MPPFFYSRMDASVLVLGGRLGKNETPGKGTVDKFQLAPIGP